MKEYYEILEKISILLKKMREDKIYAVVTMHEMQFGGDWVPDVRLTNCEDHRLAAAMLAGEIVVQTEDTE